MEHIERMRAALDEAQAAAIRGEVPVGAAVFQGAEIVARAGNECEAKNDPTAHAELLAMRRAMEILGTHTLSGCTLYVTLEPCPMCAGAIAFLRPDAVIFGAADPRAGCCGSVYRLTEDTALGLGTVPAHGGVLGGECAALLDDFFNKRRSRP